MAPKITNWGGEPGNVLILCWYTSGGQSVFTHAVLAQKITSAKADPLCPNLQIESYQNFFIHIFLLVAVLGGISFWRPVLLAELLDIRRLLLGPRGWDHMTILYRYEINLNTVEITQNVSRLNSKLKGRHSDWIKEEDSIIYCQQKTF